jgi:hypothetical protein
VDQEDAHEWMVIDHGPVFELLTVRCFFPAAKIDASFMFQPGRSESDGEGSIETTHS